MKRRVSIVGASTSGLYTAILLAEKGWDVQVLEASERLEPQPRTLITTERLRDLPGISWETAILHRIHRFELFADGKAADVRLHRPDLIVDRAVLIRSLAREAEQRGVDIRTGIRFVDLCSTSGSPRMLVSTKDAREEISSPIVVGADGALSRVARSAGWPAPRTVPLCQAVVELPPDLPPDTARVWFVPEWTPYFLWLIPHSKKQGVLGVIADSNADGMGILGEFLRAKGLYPVSYQSARVPLFGGWRTPFHKGNGQDVFLVGDAAGHVKVSTVGGLVAGLRGAVGAADSITRGRMSREFKRLRRELEQHLLIRKALHAYRQRDYVHLLGLLSPGVKRTLSLCTRDEAPRLMARLLIRQPRLFLAGLRGWVLRA